MKNLCTACFLIFFLFLVNGCKEEDDSPDPCEGIICMNDGVCQAGDCNCRPGWTGPTCETQIEPERIRINRIGIKRYPLQRPDGTSWDDGSGPDLLIEVLYGGQTLLPLQIDDRISDADGSQIYSWDMNIDVDTPGDEYQIILYDWDQTVADTELIAEMNFLAYTDDNGFPEIVEIDTGGDLAIRLFVEYIHGSE